MFWQATNTTGNTMALLYVAWAMYEPEACPYFNPASLGGLCAGMKCNTLLKTSP